MQTEPREARHDVGRQQIGSLHGAQPFDLLARQRQLLVARQPREGLIDGAQLGHHVQAGEAREAEVAVGATQVRGTHAPSPRVAPHAARDELELGQPIDNLFDDFRDDPIASASIGQVHRAKLKTGDEIVVKVQHDGIVDTVRKDLDVLTGLAQMVEGFPEFSAYRPVETVAEFQRTLRRELDFGREERNLEHFHARFADNPNVTIPRPYEPFCTSRVLVMEYVEGTKLSDVDSIHDPTLDRDELARHGVDIYLDMIFADGFFHADPHPGNIVVLP